MQDGPFAWSKEIQGHILGSFYLGYTVSQIPSGLMAERLGAKWVLFGFLGASTLATLLTPAAAWLGYGAVIAARIVSGIGSVSLQHTDCSVIFILVFITFRVSRRRREISRSSLIFDTRVFTGRGYDGYDIHVHGPCW